MSERFPGRFLLQLYCILSLALLSSLHCASRFPSPNTLLALLVLSLELSPLVISMPMPPPAPSSSSSSSPSYSRAFSHLHTARSSASGSPSTSRSSSSPSSFAQFRRRLLNYISSPSCLLFSPSDSSESFHSSFPLTLHDLQRLYSLSVDSPDRIEFHLRYLNSLNFRYTHFSSLLLDLRESLHERDKILKFFQSPDCKLISQHSAAAWPFACLLDDRAVAHLLSCTSIPQSRVLHELKDLERKKCSFPSFVDLVNHLKRIEMKRKFIQFLHNQEKKGQGIGSTQRQHGAHRHFLLAFPVSAISEADLEEFFFSTSAELSDLTEAVKALELQGKRIESTKEFLQELKIQLRQKGFEMIKKKKEKEKDREKDKYRGAAESKWNGEASHSLASPYSHPAPLHSGVSFSPSSNSTDSVSHRSAFSFGDLVVPRRPGADLRGAHRHPSALGSGELGADLRLD